MERTISLRQNFGCARLVQTCPKTLVHLVWIQRHDNIQYNFPSTSIMQQFVLVSQIKSKQTKYVFKSNLTNGKRKKESEQHECFYKAPAWNLPLSISCFKKNTAYQGAVRFWHVVFEQTASSEGAQTLEGPAKWRRRGRGRAEWQGVLCFVKTKLSVYDKLKIIASVVCGMWGVAWIFVCMDTRRGVCACVCECQTQQLEATGSHAAGGATTGGEGRWLCACTVHMFEYAYWLEDMSVHHRAGVRACAQLLPYMYAHEFHTLVAL